MNASLSICAQKTLSALEVNSNIQLFAKQWIEENGLETIEELFALFDRLQLPYRLLPSHKEACKADHRLCLFVTGDSEAKLGRFVDGKYQVFALETEQFDPSKTPEDSLNSYYILIDDAPKEKIEPDWVGGRLAAFRPLIPKLMLVSFFTNVFALFIPFITMSIYDHVIGGDAGHELKGIAIGAALLFAMMWLLRVLRSKVLATVSNRISREISQAIVQKMLSSAYTQVQTTASSTQYNQTLMSDRISGVFSGPLGSALFDLPFVILFLLAIGILGGWLVLVPIISLVCYYLLAKRNIQKSVTGSNQATVAGTNRQNMLNELSSKLGFMRSANVLKPWKVRFDKANYLASKNGFNQATTQSKYTSLYYAIGVCSTLAIIGMGIGLIFEQVMTAGGLIASMMLISRITGPAQLLANSAGRLQLLQQSKVQVNRTLTQNNDRSFSYQHQALSKEAPSIKLEQVTLRFPKQSKPALSGVSFEIESGEVVAITGPMGCGKTSLLGVVAGLQPVQSGVVELNSVNINQYDPQLLRHWSYYRATHPDILLLTVREWLDDGNGISEETMLGAIKMVGGEPWLSSLPDGLDSELSKLSPQSIFDSLIGYEAQVLIDAKALVHDYPLYLMDNPVSDCHEQAKSVFSQFIERKRSKATVIFTSHDLDLIKLADKVIVLDEGSVVYAGPVNQPESESPQGLESVNE